MYFCCFFFRIIRFFYKVNQWIEEIKENNNEDYILILVGNKLDSTPKRKISKEVIENYCKNNGIENYSEVSAKSGENAHEMYKSLVKKLFIKFSLPIINDNHEIKSENDSPFSTKFFSQNHLICYKSCCYDNII